jgi:hypothetical protein
MCRKPYLKLKNIGNYCSVAKIKNHRLESTRFYETKPSPELDSFDLLIIMGDQCESMIMKKIPGLETQKRLSGRPPEQENRYWESVLAHN